MSEQRRIFTREPVAVTIDTAEGPRTVRCRRVTFRHSPAWLDAWFAWTQAAETNDLPRMTALAIRLVKAGLPEPAPELECSAACPCTENVGLHAQIDLLDGEDFSALFEGVLDANRPKGTPATSPLAVGLTPRKRWPVWSLLASRRRSPSTSP